MENSERSSINDAYNPDEVNPLHPAAPFTASDLPIDDEGRIYHLQVKPGQIAPDILLVGDPGRAEFIGSRFLRDLEFEHEHRGLVTITGTSEITGEQATIISPVRTTVTTSGMGTPSLEIVVSELVALNEIDFETRTRKSDFPRLHIITRLLQRPVRAKNINNGRYSRPSFGSKAHCSHPSHLEWPG